MTQRARWTRARQCMCVVGILLMACSEVTDPPVTASHPPTYDGPTLFRGLILGNGPAADFLSARSGTPKLADLVKDPAQLARITLFQDRLISSISKVNPGFFTEFGRAMSSGNHTRIQAMYRKTADVMLRTVLTLREASDLEAALADRQAVDDAVSKQLATIDRNSPREQRAVRDVVEALYASVNGPKDGQGERPSFMMKEVDGGGGGGGGGCVYVYLAAVYVAAAVNVAVVSNYVVAIAIGTYLAVGTTSTPTTQLAQERMVHAIATHLAASPLPRA
jgi:SdpC family antimicrobial peptide